MPLKIADSLTAFRTRLRFAPFDISTEEGRSMERQRRTFLTILADVFSKGCGFVVLILTLRISLPYLGQERYGILATIVSFANILVALDLGIGNALIGEVAKTTVTTQEGLSSLVSRAFWVLIVVGALVTGILLMTSQVAPIAWAFKGANKASLLEVRSTLVIFALIFGFSIPLGAIRNVYFGLQRGYIIHIVSSASAIISLCLLYMVVHFHVGMPTFLFVGFGVRVLSGVILLSPHLLHGKITAFRWNYLFGKETQALLGVGGLFLLLQIGTMAGWGADSLILSSSIGPFAVVVFTLVDRAAQLISIPLFIINKPLWATYAEALARGDKAYIRRTLRNSILMTAFIAFTIASVLFLIRHPIFKFLSHGMVEIPMKFLIIYLLWMVIRSLGDCLAMYMNGVHVLKPQIILVLFFITISIPAKIYASDKVGLSGFVVAAIASYFVASIVPTFTFFRKQIFQFISN